jgi:AcrR family transcriptional regulator
MVEAFHGPIREQPFTQFAGYAHRFAVDRCLLSDMTHTAGPHAAQNRPHAAQTGPHAAQTGPRAAQKLRTRRALLDAALHLMEHQGLGSLSLREVTRTVGIVPAGFYRHFPDIESLGVALVEESLGGLRAAMRSVRSGLTDSDEIIRRSLAVLARSVHAHRAEFRFVVRERYGGLRRVRQAIADQLRLSGDELAGDLLAGRIAAVWDPARWPAADLEMLTGLIVEHMLLTAAAILEAPPDRPAVQRQVLELAGKRLRLIVLGSRHWLEE